jgi:hypothetical protein
MAQAGSSDRAVATALNLGPSSRARADGRAARFQRWSLNGSHSNRNLAPPAFRDAFNGRASHRVIVKTANYFRLQSFSVARQPLYLIFMKGFYAFS